jgi:hypothetical protein
MAKDWPMHVLMPSANGMNRRARSAIENNLNAWLWKQMHLSNRLRLLNPPHFLHACGTHRARSASRHTNKLGCVAAQAFQS